MDEVLTLHIPGEVRTMLNRTTEELARDMRLYAALMLFRSGKLSSGAAAEMAGVPRVMFLDLCAEHDIPITHITGDDLQRELADYETAHRL
jgi:predicted HTH domain antitoxin